MAGRGGGESTSNSRTPTHRAVNSAGFAASVRWDSRNAIVGDQESISLRAEDPRRGVRGFWRGRLCGSQGFVSQEVRHGG